MVTRQQSRRDKAAGRRSRSSHDDPSSYPTGITSSNRRSSRLTLLLSVLALTTSLLITLQVSRYNSGTSKVGSGWRRALTMTGLERGKGIGGSSEISSSSSNAEVDAVKQRLSAIGKQFQEEFSKFKGLKMTTPQRGAKEQEPVAQPAGMAVVPGEDVVDHKTTTTTTTTDNLMDKAPHIPEKSDEEAKEDQTIALEDLDQETLKAMFDALYSRD